VAGQAGLAHIVPQIAGVGPLMAVVAGTAFCFRSEELVMIRAVTGNAEIFLMTARALEHEVLASEKMAPRTQMGIMAFGAAGCLRRMDQLLVMDFDRCVTLQAHSGLRFLEKTGSGV